MPGERRGNNIQPPCNLKRGQASGTDLNQQSKDRNAGGLREGSEYINGGVLIHNSIIPEVSNLDKPIARA